MITVEYVVNSVFKSVTYILNRNKEGVWLVDCGDIEPLLEKIGERTILGVLLTHAHFDHIYGLPKLVSLFPDVSIYTNEWGKIALADDKLNLSCYSGCSVTVDGENVKIVKEGDSVAGIQIYETPGHNPSCLCFEVDNCFFSGDAFIPGTPVVTNLPNCNKTLANESQYRILGLSSGKTLLPGHAV